MAGYAADAPDSGRVLVIKDYAYETQAGVGIIAGDMGEPVGIQTENKLLFLYTPTRHKRDRDQAL